MALIKNLTFWLFLIAACIMTAVLSLLSDGSYYPLVILIFVLLLLIFFKYPEFGIYLIVFFFPFTYLEFIYKDVNVPYVDLLALILFFAWLIRAIYLSLEKGQKIGLKNFPALAPMSLFVFSGLLSLFNVEREWLLLSVKYLFRPIIFFYLMYVILPFNILDNMKKLYNTFKIMYVLGLGLVLMGIWSLLFPPLENVNRVLPISIFGIYPLGTNQNALAEIFVVIIPLTLILFWREKDVFLKSIYLIGAFLMAGVNLLTLSRAGWIALFLEILFLIIMKYRKAFKEFFTNYLAYFSLLLLTPIVYLMYRLFASGIVSASDSNRLKLIDIALTLYRVHPVLGNGVGTFTQLLAQVKWYLMEYGGVLDAHGFLFKTLAENGLFGTFCFLVLLGYILFVIFKGYNQAKDPQVKLIILGCLIAVIGAIVFQFFNTGYYLAKLWLPIGLAFASLRLANTKLMKNN
jgi:hypothetical protein